MHLLFVTPAELVTQGDHFGTGHFVYVTDWCTLCKCYVCSGSNMNFTTAEYCWKHMRHTYTRKLNGIRYVFPGTISKTHCSRVEKLFRVGVTLDEELLYFKDFITFDFESLLQPCPLVDDGEGRKTKVLAKHIPVSVGLCASQDDIDPMFLAHEDPHMLTHQFLIFLLLMRRRMVRRLYDQYKEVFDQLVEIICHRLILMYETLGCNMELVPEEEREEVDTLVDNLGRYKVSAEFVKQRDVWIDNLVKVKTQLEQYIRSMVCLGFNSAK